MSAAEAVILKTDDILAGYGLRGRLDGFRARDVAEGKVEIERALGALFVPKRTVLDPDTPGFEKELRRQIDRHARRLLRLDAIGGADEPPIWSNSLHVLAVAMLRHAGIPPGYLVHTGDAARDQLINYLASEKNVGMGQMRHEDGRLDVSTLIVGKLEFVGFGRPCLNVTAQMPDSAVAALPGRRLREVVDHPTTARTGALRIEDAIMADGMLTLVLEDRQEPLARTPAGTDRRWLRVPYHPKPNEG